MSKPLVTEALNFTRQDTVAMQAQAKVFYDEIKRRRSVRSFSPDAVPMEVIRDAIMAAGTAPSGANMQPWHFAITTDRQLKQQIRIAAEAEEQEFYNKRASAEWLAALEPLGTDAQKQLLETAPVLIGVFSKKFSEANDGSRRKNYYTYESVGIACGMLITALHFAGLATLTHTPSPMGFLNAVFQRPKTERAFLLLVVGYPSADCQVPSISKKAFDDIASMVSTQHEVT